MLTRRQFLLASGGLLAAGPAFYSVAIEPNYAVDVVRYAVSPPNWSQGLSLRVAVIADLHACEPWMPVARIEKIARLANSLQPDMTVLLGDYAGGTSLASAPVLPHQWAEALSPLRAPLGVYAVLGNHDWQHGALPHLPGDGGDSIRRALRHMNACVMENDARKIETKGGAFWLVGLADQFAIRLGPRLYRGKDDLPAALAKTTSDAPVILLAHEPDIFEKTPPRVALTLCGHTHGGQIYPPVLGPLAAAARFRSTPYYGHLVDRGRHIIVSAGLGVSYLPMRFMRRPEILEVTIEAGAPATA